MSRRTGTQIATMQRKTETVRLYTLEEARDIFKEENLYRLKQKACGLCIALIGAASVAILKDGTFALFAVPIGFYTMVSKKNLLY